MVALEFSDVVDLVSALAWPTALAVILIAYRKQLTEFAQDVSTRVSKVSISKVSLELASAPPLRSEVVESLSTLKDPTATAEFSDSGAGLLASVHAGERGDYTVIDIGEGREWLTSRLFLFSHVLSRVLSVRKIVFVHSAGETIRRFVGAAEPEQVADALAHRFPWLEEAFVRSLVDIQPYQEPLSSLMTELFELMEEDEDEPPLSFQDQRSKLGEIFGAIYPDVLSSRHDPDAMRWRWSGVVNSFLNDKSIRVPLEGTNVDDRAKNAAEVVVGQVSVDTHLDDTEWVTLSSTDGRPVFREHARWIESPSELVRMLGPTVLTRERVTRTHGILDSEIARQVVLSDGDLVPIVDPGEAFETMVDRHELIDRVSSEIARRGSG